MVPTEKELLPLPYHEALADYLHTAENEAWNWMANTKAREEYADELRLDLLKSTYRLDAASHPEVFAALDRARAVLVPDLPVTLYQQQHSLAPNASIYCLPGEAHIVFSGRLLQLMSPAELLGVFGHELAHYRLWQGGEGRHFTADRLAQAMAAETRAEPSHRETARLLQLYTEIYADRGALCVTGDLAPVVSALVKIATGLEQVDAASYARQADEIFARAKIRTEGVTHPETFIRTRALHLWAKGGDDVPAELARMIEGTWAIDRLDLTGQQQLAGLTRRWLRLLAREPWFQTDAVRAHARMFFPDFEFAAADHADAELLATLTAAPIGIRDYFCYLALDFAAADPDLEEEPLKAVHRLVQPLEWNDRVEALAVKELKLKKKDAKRIREAAIGSATPTPPSPEATA